MGRDVQGLGDLEKGVNGRTAQSALDLAVVGPAKGTTSDTRAVHYLIFYDIEASNETASAPV